MPITVEDGSIVADANSYVTLAEVRAYATDRGVTLPTADTDLEPKLHLAMDWFEGYEFIGSRVDVTTPQELSWPRAGVVLDGVEIAETAIPTLVKKVIMQATVDASIVELEPTYGGTSTGQVKVKKLDVIEKEFFKSEWGDQQPRLTKLIKMLAPLVGGGLPSGRLKVSRV